MNRKEYKVWMLNEATFAKLIQAKPNLQLIWRTWNFARALLTEDYCQIVEGFLEFLKTKLWK